MVWVRTQAPPPLTLRFNQTLDLQSVLTSSDQASLTAVIGLNADGAEYKLPDPFHLDESGVSFVVILFRCLLTYFGAFKQTV